MVCNEPFEQFWEEEEEAWHFRDAVRIGPNSRVRMACQLHQSSMAVKLIIFCVQLYHTYCYKAAPPS